LVDSVPKYPRQYAAVPPCAERTYEADFERFELHSGDVLLNEGQSPEFLGRPAIYRNQLPGACFTNTLIRFQAYRCVLPEFALIFFRHCMHSGRFAKESNITTNIAHLSLGRLAAVEFPVPPLAEQQRIVFEFDRQMSIVREVEAEVGVNIRRAQALRQATLVKFFSPAID
jgi:type I restriction enzyme S subunit